MKMKANEIKAHYQLLPHPEGGYYKEIYRAKGNIAAEALPHLFTGERSFSTAIYFLLEKGNFSAFHRIKSDECWHFYAGERLIVHVIEEDGNYYKLLLGKNLKDGETFQAVVPAGAWFASEPAAESDFCFVGCTVAPGFDFEDFELAFADELTAKYPQHESLIRRLCRQ
jgi:uncharacterized protein